MSHSSEEGSNTSNEDNAERTHQANINIREMGINAQNAIS